MSEAPESIDVLLVEDDTADAHLLERLVQDGGLDSVRLHRVERFAAGLQHLAEGLVDLVLLDLSLPDAQGIENVERLREQNGSVPIVVLTGLKDAGTALEAVRHGAQDYLVKGELDATTLDRSIRYAIERQRLLDELRAARQRESEVKDRFLSHVSHELRTPLNAIYQFVTILCDGIGGELTTQQQEFLGIVLRNVDQLSRMIGDLMDVARLGADKLQIRPEAAAIAPLLAEALDTIAPAASEAGVEIRSELPEDLPLALADTDRIRQVLLNLLDNAVKFTSNGGSIALGACRTEDGSVAITVTDTGCGIPESERSRIFERLEQVGPGSGSSRKGLGLGLHISREIVERHGGQLRVESTPGIGSTFSFTLPGFSLFELLQRRLAGSTSPLSLVGVAVLGGGKSDRERLAAVVHEAAECLQQCIRQTDDLLLPPGSIAGDHVAIAIVQSDAQAAAAVCARLEQQLSQRRHHWPSGFTMQLIVRPTVTTLTGDNLEAGLQELTAAIADLAQPR